MTPVELAAELHVSPNTLRSWLRGSFPRSEVDAYSRWTLTPLQVTAARAHFQQGGRTAPAACLPTQDGAPRAGQGDFNEQLRTFCAGQLFTRDEVLASPCPVPREPGVHGWWFRQIPAGINTEGCLRRGGECLLYTGISPKRPPANGRPPSTQTLQDRIKYHFTGNEGSTLRKTLGSLLAADLRIELRRVGSGSRMTFGEGEQILSALSGGAICATDVEA